MDSRLDRLEDQLLTLLQKRKFGKAIDTLQELCGQDPSNPRWFHKLGETYERLGETGEAVRAIRHAARLHLDRQDVLKAIAHCKMILDIDPDDAETITLLARLTEQRHLGTSVQAKVVSVSLDKAYVSRQEQRASAVAPWDDPPAAPAARPAAPVARNDEPAAEPDEPGAKGPREAIELDLSYDGGGQLELTSGKVTDLGMADLVDDSEIGKGQVEFDPEMELTDGSAALVERNDPAPDLGPPAPPVERNDSSRVPGLDDGSVASMLAGNDSSRVPGLDDGSVASMLEGNDSNRVPGLDDGSVSSLMERNDPTLDLGGGPGMAGLDRRIDEALEESVVMEFVLDSEDDSRESFESADELSATHVVAMMPQVPLLGSMDREALKMLIRAADLRFLTPGDLLYREGDRGESLFVIIEGQIRMFRTGPPVELIAELRDGDFFGEIALLTETDRRFTAQANSVGMVLEISREVIGRVVHQHPAVLTELMRFFRARMLDALVRDHPLFEPFVGEARQVLERRIAFLEARPGTRLVAEGQQSEGLFVLLSGGAQVLHKGQPKGHVHPGDLLGEHSFLTGHPSAVSIVTTARVWMLQLDRETVREMVQAFPQLQVVVDKLAERGRKRQANLEQGGEFERFTLTVY